jgi:hypothetical protein
VGIFCLGKPRFLFSLVFCYTWVLLYLQVLMIYGFSFGYYFVAVTLWTIQTQLLLQIIANRVGLIMVDKRKARLIKWILFVVVGLINVSVYCIWIPALLGSDQTFVTLNHIWERVEKSLFLLLDAGLNIYFLHLVRSNLIAKGLTKYWPLFNFNAAIVLVSIALDIVLLGLLSLPNTYEYVVLPH